MYITWSQFQNLSSDLITNNMTESEFNNIKDEIDRTYIDGQLSFLYDVPFHKVTRFSDVSYSLSQEGYIEVYGVNSNYEIPNQTLTFTSGSTYTISPNTTTGNVNQGVTIWTGSKSLFTVYVHTGEDMSIGDTIDINFQYDYPDIIQQASFNFATWYYLKNYFTQTTSNGSEWVESYKAQGQEIIRGLMKGQYDIFGHDRNDGVTSSPRIGEGTIQV